METPKDIDYAIYDAKLEGLSAMYVAAVHAYRQGIIDALCRFAGEFVSMRVHAVRLAADVDWRWTFDAWVDEAGEEIEWDEPEDFDFGDLFSAAYLSELDDFEAGTGYVYVADRVFSPLRPETYAVASRKA